jgi:hypothetical protein
MGVLLWIELWRELRRQILDRRYNGTVIHVDNAEIKD